MHPPARPSPRVVTASALAAAFVMLALAAGPAVAAPATLGQAIAEQRGEPYVGPLLDKLFVFKVGPKCQAKLASKDDGVARATAYVARDLVKHAKRLTGDDWDALEGQDKEKFAPQVAELIGAFAGRFQMTIEHDGDDCDNTFGARWIKYWTAITAALADHGHDAPRLAITLKVQKAARGVTTTVSADGTRIEFVVPRDVEPRGWDGAFIKPFRQRATGFMDDFAYAVLLDTDVVRARVLDRLVTIKVAPACRAKLPDPDAGARHAFSFATRDVASYASAVSGDDWDAIFSQSGDPAANRATVYEMIEAFRKRFSFTIIVDGKDCDASAQALWLRYATTVATALRNNPPPAKKVALTLTVSAKAKDVTAKASKDGSSIKLTAPASVEAKAWSDKLAAPFAKFPRNPR
ncbi:MAG: hypothetical protein KBG28_05780 [Kofleriaceae bacterium]|jgi:hypothetical protein|nr:hypothetical protein [Kofleriaceae bacterium]MBP6837046.1 hypothetical protein [Kofleriaceae bacterium]MBP9203455.1 hypothetical protein [Kofleriaceae bacterium]